MTPWRWLPVCACALASVATSARAADPASSDAATQIVGLFMQGCVRYAGDVAALRDWAVRAGMQPLPAPGQQAFLQGVPGEVFDASTKQDKLVLISDDAGACSSAVESASGPEVVNALEQAMQVSHIDFKMTHEEDDTQVKVLHHRTYAASAGDRQWGVLVSTVKDAASGEVMLTVLP